MPKIYEYSEVPAVDGSEEVILSKSQVTYKTNLQRIVDALVSFDPTSQINAAISTHESTYDHSLLVTLQEYEVIDFTYYGVPDNTERMFYTVVNKDLRVIWNNTESSVYIRQINDTPTTTPLSFPVQVNGVQVAAFEYTTGNTMSFAGAAASLQYFDVVSGDRISIVAPTSNSQIFEDITFSLNCLVL